MPRRNHHGRRRRQPVAAPVHVQVPDLTYEQMARELVKAGRCSVQILDHPQRFTTTTQEGSTR